MYNHIDGNHYDFCRIITVFKLNYIIRITAKKKEKKNFWPRTISLDGDILLMHRQIQTGFLIQIILQLLHATLLCANEDQSKILTDIKKIAAIFAIF